MVRRSRSRSVGWFIVCLIVVVVQKQCGLQCYLCMVMVMILVVLGCVGLMSMFDFLGIMIEGIFSSVDCFDCSYLVFVCMFIMLVGKVFYLMGGVRILWEFYIVLGILMCIRQWFSGKLLLCRCMIVLCMVRVMLVEQQVIVRLIGFQWLLVFFVLLFDMLLVVQCVVVVVMCYSVMFMCRFCFGLCLVGC